ncbi:MAG: hypothetical protein GY928_23865 [Colwellia sp.]|nr:hypothetical protein [Colwellia sp.]
MIKWLKKRLGVSLLEEQQEALQTKVGMLDELVTALTRDLNIAIINYKRSNQENARVLEELNRLTAVDVDTACRRGNNTVIVTGVLRGKGYVNFYDMGEREFSDVVRMLRSMGKDKWIRNIDSPINFKGAFDL